MIARHLVLLVSRLVFLIDDDQAQIPDRGEHRRPRAHDHPHLPRRQRGPAVEPLAFAEMAVPDHGSVAGGLEAAAQPRHGLRRERHFGHQIDGAASRRQHLFDRTEINLGLAGAGDAVQQMHREFPPRQTGGNRTDHGCLLVVEPRRLAGDNFAASPIIGVGHAFHLARFLAHQAALDERVRDGRRRAQPRKHQGFFHRTKLLLEKLAEAHLLGRLLGQECELGHRDRPRQTEVFFRLEPGAVTHGGGNHRLDHILHPRGVVRVHPAGEVEQVRTQRGEIVHHRRDRFQLFRRTVGHGIELHDQAQMGAIHYGHAHQRAGPDCRAQRLRHLVVQEFVETRERLNGHNHRPM